MQKLLSYFVALFVLFFACTQNQTETTTVDKNSTNPNSAPSTSVSNPQATASSEGISPTPIPAPEEPKTNIKTVPQAPKKDLKYPQRFRDEGIPQLAKSAVGNNLILENNQGKYGQRIKLTATGSHKSALDFYTKALENNGWVKNIKMDKTVNDEDVDFFSTNYSKDDYTLMLAITGTSNGALYIDQILKEN